MKKALLYIIILIVVLALGFCLGVNIVLKKDADTRKDKETGKVELYNVRILEYDADLKLENGSYGVLSIIDNEEDYEDFINKYEYSEYQKQDSFKKYNNKYKYIMLGVTIDDCSETIIPNKYKLKNDKLVISVDNERGCGVCALTNAIYEIAIDKDVEFEDVDFKFININEVDCPTDVAYKPVLYLYPEKEQEVTVKFTHPELLLTTYPKYINEWNVVAKPNGDLLLDGKYYYALYWEEEKATQVDFHEGFYVTKDNAIEFLKEKLTTIGLNDRERNEFIMYWLPILEKNGQNLVYFELTDSLQNHNALEITPTPDSLLRVRIHVKKVNSKVNIKEQRLEPFARNGFTAVEWGGVIY